MSGPPLHIPDTLFPFIAGRQFFGVIVLGIIVWRVAGYWLLDDLRWR